MMMSRRRTTHRCHGVATFMVIWLIPVLAATLLALTLLVSQQVKRSRSHERDAQLRQLLIAGAHAARQEIATWPGGGNPLTIQLAVPPVRESEGVSVHVELRAPRDNERVARVVANWGRHRGNQTLSFQRDGETWRTTGAKLER